MKGIVIKKFRDKITRSVYAAGDTIERDEARITEINQVQGGPFIEVIDDAENVSENETSGTKAESGSSAPAPEGDTAAGEKAARTPRSKKAKE